MQKAIYKSIPEWTAVFDNTPENTPCEFVDSCTGTLYRYSSKTEAVKGLYSEDARLRGMWSPGPLNESDPAAWAVVEMVIDNPAHVGLPAQPAWA